MDATLHLWIIGGLLTLMTIGIMLWPFLGRRDSSIAPREAYDMTVYKDQLDEVDRDVERGLLNEQQAEAARVELKRRLLAAGEAAKAKGEGGNSTVSLPVTLIALVALVVPVGGALMYAGLGRPDLPDQPLAERTQNSDAAEQERRSSMEDVTAKLAQRMQENPENLDGWLLLGRSYMSLERYKDAASAYARAYDLSDKRYDVGVAYAETLVLVADQNITEEAAAIFRKALETEPADPKSRFYLAMRKVQNGDIKGAIQGWVDLLALAPEGASWAPIVIRQIEKAAGDIGVDPSTFQPSMQAEALANKLEREAAAAAAQAPGPSQADIEAAQQMSEGDRNQMIRNMVERLAEKMKENPTDKQGWLRLEKAYRVLGETQKADEAAAAAAKLP